MSQLKVSSIVDTAGGNTVTINGATPTVNNTMGRNRIINGGMQIDQRNAGASVTVNDAAAFYAVDRFECQAQSADGVYTAQRSTTAPTGFINSLAITVTTADASIGSTQSYMIRQKIEGFNVADLGFGSASAKTVTLSFWVRSSLTGTFGGALINGSFNRAYPFSYSISSANTWEQKTVTIAGDTTGTWSTDSSTGIVVSFSLGAGSSRVGTAGSWAGSNYQGATGQVNLISTNGATFYITGVQLEVGSVATEFERRPYGTELALCQRYLFTHGKGSVLMGVGTYYSGTRLDVQTFFPVTMRTTPSLTTVSGTDYYSFYSNGVSDKINTFSVGDSSPSAGSGTNVTEASGTGGYSGWLYGLNASAQMLWSAEL